MFNFRRFLHYIWSKSSDLHVLPNRIDSHWCQLSLLIALPLMRLRSLIKSVGFVPATGDEDLSCLYIARFKWSGYGEDCLWKVGQTQNLKKRIKSYSILCNPILALWCLKMPNDRDLRWFYESVLVRQHGCLRREYMTHATLQRQLRSFGIFWEECITSDWEGKGVEGFYAFCKEKGITLKKITYVYNNWAISVVFSIGS